MKDLEKQGKIAKVDFSIVGKDIDKEERFNAQRDLAKKGDVFNDGEGASAFDSARDRPALNELLRRMEQGEYDVVLAETLDRYSRDPLDFALVALDLWRKGGKVFYGIKDGRGYGSAEPFKRPSSQPPSCGVESRNRRGRRRLTPLKPRLTVVSSIKDEG